MPASIPTLALTTPADAKAFLEAFPSAPEGPEKAVWGQPCARGQEQGCPARAVLRFDQSKSPFVRT